MYAWSTWYTESHSRDISNRQAVRHAHHFPCMGSSRHLLLKAPEEPEEATGVSKAAVRLGAPLGTTGRAPRPTAPLPRTESPAAEARQQPEANRKPARGSLSTAPSSVKKQKPMIRNLQNDDEETRKTREKRPSDRAARTWGAGFRDASSSPAQPRNGPGPPGRPGQTQPGAAEPL